MSTKTYNVNLRGIKTTDSLEVALNVSKNGVPVASRELASVEIDLDSLYLTDKKHQIYSICDMGKNNYAELPCRVKVAAGATNLSDSFSHCYTLTGIDVSHMDVSDITTMRDMFFTCSGITTLDISTWNTANVRDFSGMFGYCSKLQTIEGVIDMSSCATVEDAKSMFSECSALEKVKIKNPPSDFLEQKMFSINSKYPKFGYEVLALTAGQFEIVE